MKSRQANREVAAVLGFFHFAFRPPQLSHPHILALSSLINTHDIRLVLTRKTELTSTFKVGNERSLATRGRPEQRVADARDHEDVVLRWDPRSWRPGQAIMGRYRRGEEIFISFSTSKDARSSFARDPSLHAGDQQPTDSMDSGMESHAPDGTFAMAQTGLRLISQRLRRRDACSFRPGRQALYPCC